MRTSLFCSALLLSAVSVAAQVSFKESSAQSSVMVYKVGNGVTAPELLPIKFTTAECERPCSGEVELTAIVDTSGVPRSIMFVHPLGNDLDWLALSTLAAERFKPGESNGAPVPVAESIAMKLEACPVHVQTGAQTGPTYLRVHSQPEQRFGPTDVYPAEVAYSNGISPQEEGVFQVGPDVSPPVMLLGSKTIDIGSGKRAKYEGEVMLTLIVESSGMPINIRVTRPLGLGLDQKAIDAMRQARFKPAMLRGKQPVPAKITVSVQCRIY
jgi:TonB family protein